MRKTVIVLLILLTLLIAACKGINLKQDTGIVCNTPYIRFGADCCLDQNNNTVCDSDEEKCVDQCIESHCEGNYWVTCFDGLSGCKEKREPKLEAGACGVQCTQDEQCQAGYYCANYTCLTKQIDVGQMPTMIVRLGEGLTEPKRVDLGYLPKWTVLTNLVEGNSVYFGLLNMEITSIDGTYMEITYDDHKVVSLADGQSKIFDTDDGRVQMIRNQNELQIKRLTNPQSYQD